MQSFSLRQGEVRGTNDNHSRLDPPLGTSSKLDTSQTVTPAKAEARDAVTALALDSHLRGNDNPTLRSSAAPRRGLPLLWPGSIIADTSYRLARNLGRRAGFILEGI